MGRALANWAHISNRTALDHLTIHPAVKSSESKPRNKTSGLCQEVESECPYACAGDWGSATWRPTPGLRSTLPRTSSACASRMQNVSRETQDKDVNQG